MAEVRSAEIEALVAKVDRLKGELDAARQELKDAYTAALPWAVGDIVRSTYGSNVDKRCKVVRVYNAERGRAAVVRKRKDGTWGVRETVLYYFEKVAS